MVGLISLQPQISHWSPRFARSHSLITGFTTPLVVNPEISPFNHEVTTPSARRLPLHDMEQNLAWLAVMSGFSQYSQLSIIDRNHRVVWRWDQGCVARSHHQGTALLDRLPSAHNRSTSCSAMSRMDRVGVQAQNRHTKVPLSLHSPDLYASLLGSLNRISGAFRTRH